jgi:hypothetical protein
MRTSPTSDNQLPPDLHGPAAVGSLSAAGGPNDPVMREALRLMEAFLAIEDAAARTALITLAESLVSYDWVRKAQGRR